MSERHVWIIEEKEIKSPSKCRAIREMYKIKYVDMNTNKEVLPRIKEKITLLQNLVKRKKSTNCRGHLRYRELQRE